jgi:hypothetical protein
VIRLICFEIVNLSRYGDRTIVLDFTLHQQELERRIDKIENLNQ